jgi:integrase/recombinase XerD
MKYDTPNFGLLMGQDHPQDKTSARHIFDERFYNWLLLERGMGAEWARNLTWMLGRDLRTVADPNLNEEAAKALALSLMTSKMAKATVRHHLTVLEYYMTYLGRPMKFKKPRATNRSLHFLSQEQLTTLIRATRDMREFTIIAVFAQTGARLNEVRMLDIKDLDFEKHLVHIRHAKLDKERDVPMSATLERVLKNYLAAMSSHEKRPDEPLFRSIRGDRISTHALGLMVKSIGDRAGLPNVHPHALRHSFATAWVENGGDPFNLQAVLGHEDIKMTRRYWHYNTKAAHEAFQKAAPKM